MKKTHYLCLDDETKLVEKLIRRVENHFPNLSIESRPPQKFELELATIQDLHRKKKIHGILLDLRLDEASPKGGKPVRYTATGLAAQLRSWLSAKKQDVIGFPIILWSIESRMEYAFKADASNKDLFDLIFHKEKFPEHSLRAAEEMLGMVGAYRDISARIKTQRRFVELLRPVRGIEVDERIGIQFSDAFRSQPTHRYAQYIFTQLIKRPGVLINERTLCARLGIDYDSRGRARLLKRVSNSCRYRGPYGDAWPRWWSAAVDGWWRKIAEGKVLSRMAAKERVDLISTKLRVSGLTPAQPFADGYSAYFSTVCSQTHRPLDPIDGFLVSDPQSQPWQHRRYVARDVALNPAAYDFRDKIDPVDADRLKALREKLRTHGKKGRKKKSARN